MLDAVQSATAAEIHDHSIGPVGFSQLFSQPADYRGRVVTLSGTIRRGVPKRAHKNDSGIGHHWQCWLFPDGSDNPVVAYVLRPPDGFPEGQAVHEAVRLDGLFYKRWAYLAGDGIRTAPVVIARTMDWRRPPTVRQDALPALPVIVAGVRAAGVLAATTTYFIFKPQSKECEA